MTQEINTILNIIADLEMRYVIIRVRSITAKQTCT